MIKQTLQFLKRTLTVPKGLDLEAVEPVSNFFGLDRGTPIDRYYIEKFLSINCHLIKGTVLEIGESTYSKRFGSNVSSYEILHVTKDNPRATIIGDLTNMATLPTNIVDCFICTQTFNFIYNFHDAIKGAYHVLNHGGCLLATVSGISQISAYDMERWGDYWRFTTLSAQKSFGEVFGTNNVTVDFYGNCYAATSFLRGISKEEIELKKLDYKNSNYPITISIIAIKNS